MRVIVPYVAGGANDLLGRVFAEQLSRAFGQQFFVENRTGGGGLIGTEAAARAAPDGYTLITSGMPSHVLAPAMNKNASFDPVKDFTHIAYLGGPPNVFVVHPSAGMNSFKELLALMRSQPDGVQYVSPSIGSVGNMVAEYVADKEKMKLVHIVYRGGGSAIQDLVAGHVKVGSMTLSTTQPHILAGKLKPLAISSEKRVAEFPDVPTLVELGYPGLIVRTWYSLSGPAGLPRDIVAKLNAAVNKAMELPEVQKHLKTEMVQTEAMTPEADDRVHATRSEPMGADSAAHLGNKVNKTPKATTGERSMVRFVIALAAMFLAGAVTASAQSYPQRAVRFILPFGPAAGVDITARLLADKLSTRWGKPVVVENRPGGDGLIAINAFISANDDHTLLFVPASTYTAHPYSHEKLPYDAERDLQPIVNITTIVIALCSPESLK